MELLYKSYIFFLLISLQNWRCLSQKAFTSNFPASDEINQNFYKADNPEGIYLKKNLPCSDSELQDGNCKVDGHWSMWGNWSQCRSHCGIIGRRYRSRSCNSPHPLNGGAYCVGNKFDQEPCPIKDCSLAEIIQESEYCNHTFQNNGKFKSMTLDFLRQRVAANPVLLQIFNSKSALNYLDIMDVSAGKRGSKTAQDMYEADILWAAVVCLKYNTGCPFAEKRPSWSQWSEWSKCNAMCGGGISIRSRICENSVYRYLSCDGSPFETLPCNTHSCPKSAYKLFEWSEWSNWTGCQFNCSSSGSNALKTRSRCCELRPSFRNNTSVIQYYGIGNDGCLTTFDDKNKTVRIINVCEGVKTEISVCSISDQKLLFDSSCDGNPYWSSWSEWSCSVICGMGRRTRWRTCLPRNIASSSQWNGCHRGQHVQHSTCFPRPCKVKETQVAIFDGQGSSLSYFRQRKPSSMFHFYAKFLSNSPDGTLLWRAEPTSQQCRRNSFISCFKMIHISLADHYIKVKAKNGNCSVELSPADPLKLEEWTGVSVMIEQWTATVRVGTSTAIMSSHFSCESDRRKDNPNWDMRTTIGSQDGVVGFFSGAIVEMTLNYLHLPMVKYPSIQPYGVLIEEVHNVTLQKGDWDEHILRLEKQEKLLIPIMVTDKRSYNFSFAVRTLEASGTIVTLVGYRGSSNGSVPPCIIVFVVNNSLRMRFQCFEENFQRKESRNCFKEKILSNEFKSHVWHLFEIRGDSQTVQLSVTGHQYPSFIHDKNFTLKYLKIGGETKTSKYVTSDSLLWIAGIEMQFSSLIVHGYTLHNDDLSSDANFNPSIKASSVAESYTEIVRIKGQPLVVSCDYDAATTNLTIFDNPNKTKLVWLKSDKIIDNDTNGIIMTSERLTMTEAAKYQSGFYSCMIVDQAHVRLIQAFGIESKGVQVQPSSKNGAMFYSLLMLGITTVLILLGGLLWIGARGCNMKVGYKIQNLDDKKETYTKINEN